MHSNRLNKKILFSELPVETKPCCTDVIWQWKKASGIRQLPPFAALAEVSRRECGSWSSQAIAREEREAQTHDELQTTLLWRREENWAAAEHFHKFRATLLAKRAVMGNCLEELAGAERSVSSQLKKWRSVGTLLGTWCSAALVGHDSVRDLLV